MFDGKRTDGWAREKPRRKCRPVRSGVSQSNPKPGSACKRHLGKQGRGLKHAVGGRRVPPRYGLADDSGDVEPGTPQPKGE